jgi:hypothetical protein
MAESTFLELNSRDDLQRLIDDEIQESLTLCKDVSAFANSAGGQIVYGITEEGHLPSGIDGGVDPQEISREWIEQIINSNVQPRIRGLTIKAIPLDGDLTAYALTIPPSTTAHQAPDKRYYRRFNFQSVAMDDYEVRDVMNRSSSAEPFIRLHFKNGHIAGIKSQPNAHASDPVELYVLSETARLSLPTTRSSHSASAETWRLWITADLSTEARAQPPKGMSSMSFTKRLAFLIPSRFFGKLRLILDPLGWVSPQAFTMRSSSLDAWSGPLDSHERRIG